MGPLALLGIGAGISALGNVVNNLMSRSNAQFAYDKFNSPAAQVRGFQQAGMNPAVAMSESGGSSGGSQAAPPAPSENPFGMVNLETYANSLKALADAKKAGVDTRSAEEDIKLKQIEQDSKEFELRLQKYFGTKERASALALLEKNVRIAQLTGDTKEQEKAINEWIKAKEKAISEAEENKRDILKKELDNTDKRLKLENRVLSTQGDANSAAANASNAAALNSKQQAALTEQEVRIKKVLADNSTTPQMVKKQLEVMFEKLKAEGIQSKLDSETAFREWMQIHAQNKYFEDKPHDFAADVFLAWLRTRIGVFK